MRNQFVEFDIYDELSEGEINLDLHNDRLMKDEDENTFEIRTEASRGKLAIDKKRIVFR